MYKGLAREDDTTWRVRQGPLQVTPPLTPLTTKPVPITQQAQDDGPMTAQCWASVVDGGPTSSRHWPIVLYLLGGHVSALFISYLYL